MTTMTRLTCITCGAKLTASPQAQGLILTCPRCGAMVGVGVNEPRRTLPPPLQSTERDGYRLQDDRRHAVVPFNPQQVPPPLPTEEEDLTPVDAKPESNSMEFGINLIFLISIVMCSGVLMLGKLSLGGIVLGGLVGGVFLAFAIVSVACLLSHIKW